MQSVDASGGVSEAEMGRLLLEAVKAKDSAAVHQLLQASPAAATVADSDDFLPLHHAAWLGSSAIVQQLLEAAPQTATTAVFDDQLPLHLATYRGNAAVVRQLLEAAPEAATAVDYRGELPLHTAVRNGKVAVVQLLLAAAPDTAMARSSYLSSDDVLPLGLAIEAAMEAQQWHQEHLQGLLRPEDSDDEGIILPPEPSDIIGAAQLLVATAPKDEALPELARAGELAIPLYPALVTSHQLTALEWDAVPNPCPGLGRALPAVLARSEGEAACLVAHLPAADRQRLQAFALCLGRVQRQLGVELPAVVVSRLLASIDL